MHHVSGSNMEAIAQFANLDNLLQEVASLDVRYDLCSALLELPEDTLRTSLETMRDSLAREMLRVTTEIQKLDSLFQEFEHDDKSRSLGTGCTN